MQMAYMYTAAVDLVDLLCRSTVHVTRLQVHVLLLGAAQCRAARYESRGRSIRITIIIHNNYRIHTESRVFTRYKKPRQKTEAQPRFCRGFL